MIGRLVLHDLEAAQAGALVARAADVKLAVPRRSQQLGADRGKEGPGIEIARDPHRVVQHRCVDVAGIGVDAAYERHELACLGSLVGAPRIERLSDELKAHALSRISDAG
ncbi:MAG TPA: hypothetical protein VG224_27035 [Reyranella sp.]|nr:hypothetical protein [Reyranella sp.]